MFIPPDYTPVQITVPNDKDCITILNIWKNIYFTNRDTFSYISHLSLARRYNLIYAFIKTDNLKLLRYPYTVIPISSAENIEFYKLNYFSELILKEEKYIQEIVTFDGTKFWYKNTRKRSWYKDSKPHNPYLIYADGYSNTVMAIGMTCIILLVIVIVIIYVYLINFKGVL